ncbi:DUF3035 domain-containing protein [Thalassospira sp. SM2505]|uniref:Beta-barrel assembly machine subunit BamF n=1 Tax=Thalassospira profundimaris TaxID=502049 RepID=A0A367WXR7_9PROT|nr:DUF3035 domain-containing protein [Thalassospira profundimaris]RCK46177.1 hypothetical protein TH30_10160 [Thalassospira profundimaris]
MARKLTTSIFRIALLGGLALGVSGCESTRETFGLNKQSPDEFAVVSRAPLSLPPDFTMRVPDPGAPRPQTGSTTDQARRILVGDDPTKVKRDITSGTASKGQVALLSASGAQYADPEIRSTVDRETSIFISESESIVDDLLFWQEKQDPNSVVDPTAEAKRIRDQQALGDSVSGGGNTPVIERKQKGWLEDIF